MNLSVRALNYHRAAAPRQRSALLAISEPLLREFKRKLYIILSQSPLFFAIVFLSAREIFKGLISRQKPRVESFAAKA